MTHSQKPRIDAELLLEHEGWIRRLARGLVRDAHDVDDVVQQTWLNALLWPPRRDGDLRGWLAAVLRNVVRQRHRGEQRARRWAQEGARPEADVTGVGVTERLEWQRKLADTVLELRPMDREVLVLRYYDDLGPRQIAKHMGLPLHTVKSRLARAKARLRSRLQTSWKRSEGGADWRTSLCVVAFGTTAAPRLATASGGTVGSHTGWLLGGAAVMIAGLVFVALPDDNDRGSAQAGAAVIGGPAEIVVTVTYSGPAPARVLVDMGSDPVCLDAQGEGHTQLDFVVDERGGLAEVMVNLSGVPGRIRVVRDEAVALDQRDCVFEPRVFGVRVKQDILLRNSDPTLHSVHALAQENGEFHLALPMQGMTVRRRFREPERELKIVCDVHPWMAAWCFVFDHPHFAVSDLKGLATLPGGGLPDGRYTVKLWHPSLGAGVTELDVVGGAGQVDFQFGDGEAR